MSLSFIKLRKLNGQSFFFFIIIIWGAEDVLEKQAQLLKTSTSLPICLSWTPNSFGERWPQRQAFSRAAEQTNDLIRKCALKGIIQCLMKENATQCEHCDVKANTGAFPKGIRLC